MKITMPPPRAGRPARPFVSLCAALLALALLAACADAPRDARSNPESRPQPRLWETRRYDGIGERTLFAACAAVFQGLGFTLDRAEPRLGLIVASRPHEGGTDAGSGSGPRPFRQVGMGRWGGFGGFGLAFDFGGFGGGSRPVERDQTVRATLAILPATDAAGRPLADGHLARVSFQREARRSDGSVHAEPLTDPRLYRAFHERLGKAVSPGARRP